MRRDRAALPCAAVCASHGLDCILVCPSKVPRKPGERVKTDRRDADDLARLYRAGELTGIYVPEPEDEAMRDLLRARFQVGRQQHRARQQLKMYLLRHNLRYGGQTSWSPGAPAVSGQNQNALPGPADRLSRDARSDHATPRRDWNAMTRRSNEPCRAGGGNRPCGR